MRPRLAVLISGRGSNLQSLIDATREERLRADIAIVVSNVPEAAGLARARRAGIPTRVMVHREWPSRDAYDTALAAALADEQVSLVCLAGFMRLLGPRFLESFPNRVLNIHPSLLPAFPGMHAQRQAFDYGVTIAGATVHLVTAQLDEGPIVDQAPVAVRADDTLEALAARILEAEHELYPRAVQRVLDGKWRLVGRRFVEDRADSA